MAKGIRNSVKDVEVNEEIKALPVLGEITLKSGSVVADFEADASDRAMRVAINKNFKLIIEDAVEELRIMSGVAEKHPENKDNLFVQKVALEYIQFGVISLKQVTAWRRAYILGEASKVVAETSTITRPTRD